MMMLWPQPTSESLRSIYDDKYFKNEKFLSNNIASLYGYVDYLSEKRHKRLDMGIILRSIREQLKAPQTEFGIRNSGQGLASRSRIPKPETRASGNWLRAGDVSRRRLRWRF